MALNIKIAGANGYIGQLLSYSLTQSGHIVSGIDRKHLVIDNTRLMRNISGCDVVINLAGATLLKKWTPTYRAEIYNSRVYSSLAIATAIRKLPESKRPKMMINASAIGIYKPGATHGEQSELFDEFFLGKLVCNWEKPILALQDIMKVFVFRMSPVLGKNSGALKYLLPIYRTGLGGFIGDGLQPFPFVHEKDVIKVYTMAIEDELAGGVYNLVSPQQINNKQFSDALAQSMNRKAFLKVPNIILRLIHGEAADILLKTPMVNPSKLLSEGYQFIYPDISEALRDIVSK